MPMSEEARQKARERMLAMHAAKKGIPAEPVKEQPKEDIEALKARIAELEKETPKELPKDEQIKNAYQTGRTSIQTIARVYGVTVDYVLNLIGEGGLSSVTFGGDMIDEQEAGKDVAMNYGTTTKVPFNLD